MRNAYKIQLIEKSEVMELLGRSRRRWEDNNKLELKVLRFKVTDWMSSLKPNGYYILVYHKIEH
jgi:hypothetical protein